MARHRGQLIRRRLQSPVFVFAAIGQAAGATLAVVTGATVLRRIPGFSPTLVRLRDALAFIAYGAFGSALISSSIGLASLYFAGATGYSGLGAAWLIYWLGDATGALLVTPLAFALPLAFRFRSASQLFGIHGADGAARRPVRRNFLRRAVWRL